MVFNLLPWRRRSRAYSYSYSFSYARTRFEKSQKASMSMSTRKSMSFLLQQSNNFRLAIERSRHG